MVTSASVSAVAGLKRVQDQCAIHKSREAGCPAVVGGVVVGQDTIGRHAAERSSCPSGRVVRNYAIDKNGVTGGAAALAEIAREYTADVFPVIAAATRTSSVVANQHTIGNNGAACGESGDPSAIHIIAGSRRAVGQREPREHCIAAEVSA